MADEHPFSEKVEALFVSLTEEEQVLVLEVAEGGTPLESLDDKLFWVFAQVTYEVAPEEIQAINFKDYLKTFAMGWDTATRLQSIREASNV